MSLYLSSYPSVNLHVYQRVVCIHGMTLHIPKCRERKGRSLAEKTQNLGGSEGGRVVCVCGAGGIS